MQAQIIKGEGDAAAAAEDERCAAPHIVRDAAEKKCIRISDRLILPARFPTTCHIPAGNRSGSRFSRASLSCGFNIIL